MVLDIPKSTLNAALSAASLFARLPNGESAGRVHFNVKDSECCIEYANYPYCFRLRLTYEIPLGNASFTCSIATLQKIASASGTEVSIRDFNTSYVAMLPGAAAISIETILDTDADYEFTIPDNHSAHFLDYPAFRSTLQQLNALLHVASSVADKCIICKGKHAFVNVGSVLGRSQNVFDYDFSVSKYLLDAVSPLINLYTTGSVELNKGSMSLWLYGDGNATCEVMFPVTDDPHILGSFLSPLFIRAFDSDDDKAFGFDTSVMLQHLKAVASMGYYDDTATLDLHSKEVTLRVKCNNGSAFEKDYPITEGSAENITLRVASATLIALLGASDEYTRFSYAMGNLLMNTASATYCLRSSGK